MVMKGVYYNSGTGFDVSAINTNLFTIIYYAFLIPNRNTFQLDISQHDADMLTTFTSTLGAVTPPVKMLLSVGGGGTGEAASGPIFSQLSSNNNSRSTFIMSCITTARKYGFHGVDLDWELPQTTLEMTNFGLLLDEFRAADMDGLQPSQQLLILTAAVNYASTITYLNNLAYPYDSMNRNLEWINVMNYDYYGSWTPSQTGAHAALYNTGEPLRSTDSGLKSWIQAGIPKSKLVMGMPLYGRTWTLVDPTQHGIGAPASGVGPGGDEGALTYRDVIQFNRNNNAVQVYDSATVSAYSYSGNAWIGYDDVQTVRTKVAYAKALGITGYFFWAVHGDDSNWTISTTASDTLGQQ